LKQSRRATRPFTAYFGVTFIVAFRAAPVIIGLR
jgi:hypothetical protein